MWASLIGAGVGLASSILAGKKAADAAKKAEQSEQQERQRAEDSFTRRYYQDQTQTAEAQSLLNRARETAEKYVSQAAARARVGNGSAEEVAAAIEKANDLTANVASNVAAQGTQYKQGLEKSYDDRMSSIMTKIQNRYNQEAAANTAAGNAGMQAGMGLVNADLQSKLKTGSGLFPNMFKA